MAETKLDPSFPNSEFLIPGCHELMRLDVTSKRGRMLVYIKPSLSSRIMPNFKLPENIQVIPLESNRMKRKWFLFSVYKSPFP